MNAGPNPDTVRLVSFFAGTNTTQNESEHVTCNHEGGEGNHDRQCEDCGLSLGKSQLVVNQGWAHFGQK